MCANSKCWLALYLFLKEHFGQFTKMGFQFKILKRQNTHAKGTKHIQLTQDASIGTGNCFKTKWKPPFSIQLSCVSISQKIHLPDFCNCIPTIWYISWCECSPKSPSTWKYVWKLSKIYSEQDSFEDLALFKKIILWSILWWLLSWRVEPRLGPDWKCENIDRQNRYILFAPMNVKCRFQKLKPTVSY